MLGPRPDDAVIHRYLLDEMSADDRAAFQQEIFDNDEWFARLCEMEDRLTDALARGEISATDVDGLRRFLEAAAKNGQPALNKDNLRWLVPLTACVAMGVTGLVLGIRAYRQGTQATRAPLPRDAAGRVFRAELLPDVQRGWTPPTAIHVPAESAVVELSLRVPSPGTYHSYRVDVARKSGRRLMSMPVPSPLPSPLPVTVPRPSLPAGDYEITLLGLDPARNPQAIDYYNCRFF
jgi:hypothetical protein